MPRTAKDTRFSKKVLSVRPEPLKALEITTLQVNVGYQCNLACKHCHVASGPARTEIMDKDMVDAVLRALSGSPVNIVDITGGAPELNPSFRYLVKEARNLGRHVIVRTNLAIFYEKGMADLPEFYQDHDVELVASLPYYLEDNVDRVRGSGTFKKCIAALQKLNSLGYGNGTGGKNLSLVYNPQGAFLPPAQKTLEEEYKKELKSRFNIFFNHLYAFTNMPLGRFEDFLTRTGSLEKYMDKLTCAFNPQTLDSIMCRHLISVRWDGALFDCDFNQVLGLPLDAGAPAHIRDFDHDRLATRLIDVGDHCFGCTAGQGSS
ncbi:MAG TPA: arsenosugar biosynthesis radical SAM (seleno)protein ArsS [Nitrospirota bacterium]|nr:arsenosugar biosynthesis radical SAM (seleno)protein ArsS [Nitrospirota bacterium]